MLPRTHLILLSSLVALLSCLTYIRTESNEFTSDDLMFPTLDSEIPSSNNVNNLKRSRLHRWHRMWNTQATKRLHNLNEYQSFRNDYLNQILRVRVPGTIGHHHVKNFIKNTLEKFQWTVELDEFSTETPVGVRKFTNIIATLHPKADRVLAIAAHYDSKDPHEMDLGEGEFFLGATDSAVPCAMMLDFAKQLSDRSIDQDPDSVKVSPMLIFLDGEEAFKEWSHTDSLYGSRHLAKLFSKTPYPNKLASGKGSKTLLDSLEAFILLDLIGTKSPPPQFWDLYSSTSKLYNHLQKVEEKLKDSLFGRQMVYFPGKGQWEVEDDHMPFLKLGVPILHLIPIPFPTGWHKVGDDEDSLDADTIVNLLRIFRTFLVEHLHKLNKRDNFFM